jgi:hypothetical protein
MGCRNCRVQPDGLPVLTKHVYGHQDEDIAYDQLPLDAQMSTEADALAPMELAEFFTTLHHVPFDPESRVMLSTIDDTTATRLQSALKPVFTPSSPTTRIDFTGINAHFTQSTGTHLVASLSLSSASTPYPLGTNYTDEIPYTATAALCLPHSQPNG